MIFRIAPGGAYQVVLTMPVNSKFGLNSPQGLVEASDGNFYGLAGTGGGHQFGGVFRLTPSGEFTNLYEFGAVANDGTTPAGALIQASDGNLYGVTNGGGVNREGTIFRISLSGEYAKILDFGQAVSGGLPVTGPMQASDGNLWGGTPFGGTGGNGNIYAVTLTGTMLQDISIDCSIGIDPAFGFTQGVNGKLYTSVQGCGTTPSGGAVIAVDVGLPPPKPSIAAFTPPSGPPGTTVVISGV